MIVDAIEPKTGKAVRLECAAQSESEIRDLLSFDLSEEALRKRIGALEISADAKSLLFTVAKTTITVGTTVIKIGRKVLDVITTLLAEFPMTSAVTVFGAIFGFLISSIPVIGFVLGPLVGALAVALGFAIGAIQDLGNKALERRIMASVASFDSLKPRA